jgi:hypothetical protein
MAIKKTTGVEGGRQYGNGNTNHHLGGEFFMHKGIITPVKRVEFISERLLYITLRVP